MEKEVDMLFGSHILLEAAERFGLNPNPNSFQKRGDFENYVFEADQNGLPVILRLTHSSHRSQNEVLAELEWIRFLRENGVDIPSCLDSQKKELTEVIPAGDTYFTAALFEKATGKHADRKNPEQWNADLFREWGRITGEMHRATSGYAPANPELSRPQWHEDEQILHAERYIQLGDEFILDRLKTALARMHALPQSHQTFGLIHTDIHPGNFFVDAGRIQVFDFDDSHYNWYIHDVAIPLYYSITGGIPSIYEGDRNAFAADFLQAFWSGYSEIFPLDPAWLDTLADFLIFRDLTLYLVFHKKVEPEKMSERDKQWMAEIRDRLFRQVPIAELDFRKLITQG